MTFILTEQPSMANDFLAELRDVDIQGDSLRFRRNLERIGELLAFEISKHLEYEEREIKTPLATHRSLRLKEQPVLATVLRAGLPMFQGFLNVFDRAQSAFTGAYRVEGGTAVLPTVQLDYLAGPSLEGRTLILIDPMLATGGSMVRTFLEFGNNGKPAKVFVAAAIASQQGVDRVLAEIPDVNLFVGDIDPVLNDMSYIVPGLGDAGDLCYGGKI